MTPAAGWAGVFFDLDGTLADTEELILRSYRHTMVTHLGKAPPDNDFLATMGIPLPRQIRAFASDEDQAEAMRRTYVEFQRTIHDEMVAPFPGASSVLSTLRQHGVRLAVVTSKASGIARRTLERCELWDGIDTIVCHDQVEHPKPHPQSVERALDELGLAAHRDRVVFVGDSPFDMQAGRAAGVRTAAALWGPFRRAVLDREEPDFHLTTLEEVLLTRPPEARGLGAT